MLIEPETIHVWNDTKITASFLVPSERLTSKHTLHWHLQEYIATSDMATNYNNNYNLQQSHPFPPPLIYYRAILISKLISLTSNNISQGDV